MKKREVKTKNRGEEWRREAKRRKVERSTKQHRTEQDSVNDKKDRTRGNQLSYIFH